MNKIIIYFFGYTNQFRFIILILLNSIQSLANSHLNRNRCQQPTFGSALIAAFNTLGSRSSSVTVTEPTVGSGLEHRDGGAEQTTV